MAVTEGSTVAQGARRIGVTEQTFYWWRTGYGGLRIDLARRLKRLESENSRLKSAVANLTLDNQILSDVPAGCWVILCPHSATSRALWTTRRR